MKKNTLWFTLLLIMCLFAGCGKETEKICRIEILSADNTYITTLEEQSQADVAGFFDEEHWIEAEDIDTNLVPEYILNLYQEKTHTLLQAGKEDTYEKIAEYTVYKDSNIVKTVISQDIAKGGLISEEDLTIYYIGTEDFFALINSIFIPH